MNNYREITSWLRESYDLLTKAEQFFGLSSDSVLGERLDRLATLVVRGIFGEDNEDKIPDEAWEDFFEYVLNDDGNWDDFYDKWLDVPF